MRGRARAYRIAFAVGGAAFLLAFVAGAWQSLRSDDRLPRANLLVDGPAEHVEELLRNGHYATAVRELRTYERTSNDRLPHERLGTVLLRLGPEVRAAFARALRDHPGYAPGHYQLGLALSAADEHARAATELEEAVRLRPGWAAAQTALGVVRARLGRDAP